MDVSPAHDRSFLAWGRQALQTGVGLLADLAFPRRCGLCGSFGTFLCAPCVAGLPAVEGQRCSTCARTVTRPGPCTACAALPSRPLDSLTAAYRFDEGARRLVHRLKYERLSALAEPMGGLMAASPGLRALLAGVPAPVDLIVPVPLHPRRERGRGFNQAALLARAIGRASAVESAPRALARVRATPPQVRQTGAVERVANVAGAFACRAPVAGRAILLVDDVATTGATLRVCAETLRAAGACAVHAAVFAHDD